MFVVFYKELIILLRSRRAYWLLFSTLLLVGGILLLGWLNFQQRGGGSIGQRAMFGRVFFMTVTTAQLCVMALISPLLSATMITTEREAKTLDLLICSGLSRAQLVLGKWLATIFFQLVIAFCLLPIISLVFQLGGVDFAEYLFAAALIAITVLTYGMIGLAFSARRRKSNSALLNTLVVILSLAFLLPVFMLFFSSGLIGQGYDPSNPASTPGVFDFVFWSTSPVLTWVQHLVALESAGRAAGRTVMFNPIFIVHIIFQALVFFWAFRAAWRRVIRPVEEADDYSNPAIDLRSISSTTGAPNWIDSHRPTRPRHQPVADGQNPIQIKEFNSWMEGRTYTLVALLTLFLLPSAILLFPAIGCTTINFMRIMSSTVITLLLLVIPIFASGAVSREHEEGTLDMLRITPYSLFSIIHAKFFAIMRMILLMILALISIPSLVRVIVIVLAGSDSDLARQGVDSILLDVLFANLLILFPILAFAALYTALSLYFSSRQRRSMTAMLQSYMATGALMAIPIPMIMIFESLGLTSKQTLAKFVFSGILPLINQFTYFFPMNSSMAGIFALGEHRSLPAMLFWMALHAAILAGISASLMQRAARHIGKE